MGTGDPLAENVLVERARHGDVAAYGELVERYQQLAFRTAYAISGNAADAEEAAQDGFVKAFAALRRFRAGAPLRPWLLTIVSNEARNRRRSAGRRGRLVLRAADHHIALGSGAIEGSDAEAALLEAERRADLAEALGALRESDRAVITCRYLLELSEEETACALGLRRGTVKSRLSRALGRLEAELGKGER